MLFGSKKSWTGKIFILHCGLTAAWSCRQGYLLEDGFYDSAFVSAQNDRLGGIRGTSDLFISEIPTIKEYGALGIVFFN